MGKKSKLVLDKNTVKSIKVRTEVKTGAPNGGNNTYGCGAMSGGCGGGVSNPGQGTSANYSRAISGAF